MGIWAAVKYALNSTLGTSNFLPLDKILSGGSVTFSTPGQYTFTVPTAVRCLKITACGGGGGGGGGYQRISGSSGSERGGGGGGSGDYVIDKFFYAKPQQVIQITVGAGGAGGVGQKKVLVAQVQ